MKVTVHSGLTFQVGPMSSNQYAKVDITFTDIDPDQPLEDQMKGGKKAVAKAMTCILKEIDEQVEEVFNART